jgi:hypothetical protein
VNKVQALKTMKKTTKKKRTTKTKTFRVWRPAYRPFIHGGNVNAPICIETPADEIHTAKGFSVGLIRHKAKTLVFCAASGGVVGDDIMQVMDDIKTGKPSVIRKQIAQAKREGADAIAVTPDEFFGVK